MGVVLRALDEKLHRVVAIKVLAPELAVSPTEATARELLQHRLQQVRGRAVFEPIEGARRFSLAAKSSPRE